MMKVDSWFISEIFYKDDDNPRWTQCPSPLDDESYTSWYVRTVKQNCADPWPTYRISLKCKGNFRDLDRGLSAKKELFKNLEPFIDTSSIQFNHTQFYNKARWSFKIRYCPLCLKLDPVPYYRLSWQFNTKCHVHDIDLNMACPSCRKSVLYWKNKWSEPVNRCYNCSWDLSSDAIPPKIVRISDEALKVAIKTGMTNDRIMTILNYWDFDRINKLRPSPPAKTHRSRISRVLSDDDIKIFIQSGRTNSEICAFLGRRYTPADSDRINQIRKECLLTSQSPSPMLRARARALNGFSMNLTKSKPPNEKCTRFNDDEITTSILLGRTNAWIFKHMHIQYDRINRLRMSLQDRHHESLHKNTYNNITRNLPNGFCDEEIKAAFESGRSNSWILRYMNVSYKQINQIRKE